MNCDVWPPPYNMRSYKGTLLQNMGELGNHESIITPPLTRRFRL
jgi:hypothetical protein